MPPYDFWQLFNRLNGMSFGEFRLTWFKNLFLILFLNKSNTCKGKNHNSFMHKAKKFIHITFFSLLCFRAFQKILIFWENYSGQQSTPQMDDVKRMGYKNKTPHQVTQKQLYESIAGAGSLILDSWHLKIDGRQRLVNKYIHESLHPHPLPSITLEALCPQSGRKFKKSCYTRNFV